MSCIFHPFPISLTDIAKYKNQDSPEDVVKKWIARYAGTDKVDLIENSEMGYCSLIKAAKNVLSMFELLNTTRTKIDYYGRLERNLVDSVALKEAVINAIVHNDYFSNATPVFEVYSDRITVTSIGNLADGMSKEDFFAGYSMPRNRELMRIFKDVRLVEQLGSGIQRILKAYEKNIFTFTDAYIKVTFLYLQDFVNKVINTSLSSKTEVIEINDAIVQMIDENNRITVDEIAKRIGLNRRSILRRLQKLQDDGKILRVGSSRAGHWEKRE